MSYKTLFREVPGNRPCSACGKCMDDNSRYNFADGVRCLCTPCHKAGYSFTPRGHVLDPRGRVVGVKV